MAALLLCCCVLPVSAFGQVSTVLAHARNAYEDFDFARARSILIGLVADPADATTSELAQAHLLLGVLDYTEQKPADARTHFVSALQLQPDIRPDAATVSPKIVEFFDDLIDQSAEPADRADEPEVRYVTLVDDRPGAALRSMLLPGWGQLHKGDRTKGIVLGSAWIAAAGATVFMHASRARARDAYLDETDPDLVTEKYDVFNRRHRARNALAISAAAIWLASYVDALATPGRSTIRPVTVSAIPTTDGATFTAVIRL